MTTTTTLERDAIVQITDRALAEARAIFERERPAEGAGLRLGVVGGGCSGFSYLLEFSEPRPGDRISDYDGIPVLIDPKSAIYLKGTVLDFQAGLNGKGFTFSNPNARNTCGCGESFTV